MKSFTTERWHGDRGALVAIQNLRGSNATRIWKRLQSSGICSLHWVTFGGISRRSKPTCHFPNRSWKLSLNRSLTIRGDLPQQRFWTGKKDGETCPLCLQAHKTGCVEEDMSSMGPKTARNGRGSRSWTCCRICCNDDARHLWDAELKRYYRFLPDELPDFGTAFTNDCDDRLYARFKDDTVKELRGSVEDDLGKQNSKGQKNGKNQGKSLTSNTVCPTNKKTRPSGSLHHVTQLLMAGSSCMCETDQIACF